MLCARSFYPLAAGCWLLDMQHCIDFAGLVRPAEPPLHRYGRLGDLSLDLDVLVEALDALHAVKVEEISALGRCVREGVEPV